MRKMTVRKKRRIYKETIERYFSLKLMNKFQSFINELRMRYCTRHLEHSYNLIYFKILEQLKTLEFYVKELGVNRS